MFNIKKLFYLIIPVTVVLVGIFIYPTLYKYDKLEQKFPVQINRITGEAKVLTSDGWVSSEDFNAAADKLAQYKMEIQKMIEDQTEDISNKVSSSVEERIMSNVKDRLGEIENEITAYKEFKIDPANMFTTGSSKEDVKKAMGTPDRINSVGPYSTFFYGRSTVHFDNGKVDAWNNADGNLMLK